MDFQPAVEIVRVPQQEDDDCGVFTLAFAGHISRDAKIDFTARHIIAFRRQIMGQLMMGEVKELRYLLAIEKMKLRGDRDYPESEREVHSRMISPLPLYLTCELISKLEDNNREEMIENFYNGLNSSE